MKNIGVVTGTRAEYGLLRLLIKKIDAAGGLNLTLIVTGMHLSPEFGLTYREIEADGFKIDKRIEMLLSSDTPGGVLKSMGLELIAFADYLAEKNIDMIVLLGDRYESFVAAAAALFFGIPIAHIHGGESTEGAVDEALRHSITKMSAIHFAATEVYRRRIIQLGEQTDSVYNVGALGIENIKEMPLLDKKAIESFIGLTFETPVFMVTYHPVTMEKFTAQKQMEDLLSALDHYQDCKIIFTKANSDVGGRIINQLIDNYAASHADRCAVFVSMGQLRYFSALNYCSMVIGNSSSGIIEAPSFHIPTVNIGDRQKGRVCAKSVIHCGTDTKDIIEAIQNAFGLIRSECLKHVDNPYEKKGTSDEMIFYIEKYLNNKVNTKKKFNDITFC